ncbi:MAG: PCRF domain-containing protein, partial [Gemmatimonadaceae bacterium]
MKDARRLAELGREHHRLGSLVGLGTRFQKLEHELREAQGLVDTDDSEMAEEARQEVQRLQSCLASMEAQLTPLLIPHDPLDERKAIVEIRAGTGGDEAALFAADLHRMYT